MSNIQTQKHTHNGRETEPGPGSELTALFSQKHQPQKHQLEFAERVPEISCCRHAAGSAGPTVGINVLL